MQIPDFPIGRDQREETRHGSAAFPFALYESRLSANISGRAEWHWHPEVQLCLVKRGAIRVCLAQREVELGQGEGVFINSGFLHMICPVEDPDSTYWCIDFSAELLRLFPGSVFERRYLDPFLGKAAYADCALRPAVPWQKAVLEAVREMVAADAARPWGYEYAIAGLLARSWTLLMENLTPEKSEQGRQVAVGRARCDAAARAMMAYLNAHYGEAIGVEDVAAAVHYSPAECCRIFKRVTQSTLFSYLRLYRVTQSTKLLKDTDLPVSEIALECGFSSPSHFISAFKAVVGVTPLHYRKR